MKLYNIFDDFVTIEKGRFGDVWFLYFSGYTQGVRYSSMFEAVQHANRMGYTRQYPTI